MEDILQTITSEDYPKAECNKLSTVWLLLLIESALKETRRRMISFDMGHERDRGPEYL